MVAEADILAQKRPFEVCDWDMKSGSVGAFVSVSISAKKNSLELAPYGIRVVTVAHGLIETNLVDSWKEDPDLWRSVQAAQMRERAGKPEDVAKLVAFLASDDAAFVNGHDFFVDDGAASFKG